MTNSKKVFICEKCFYELESSDQKFESTTSGKVYCYQCENLVSKATFYDLNKLKEMKKLC